MFDLKHVCTDHYPAYRQIVPKDMHVETKSETAAIEGLNSRIRHYPARFRRKTFCYSKAKHMVKATLTPGKTRPETSSQYTLHPQLVALAAKTPGWSRHSTL